jgi:hypothetical protein
MDKPWFDARTGTLLLDEYVASMPSFQKVMQDGVVTDNEIAEIAHKTVALLRQLEEMLSPEAKAVATEALCQLAVLYALQRIRAQAR